jgi:hypothetical protein
MTAGTAWFFTTGLPSGASVGASIAASKAISNVPSNGNTIAEHKTEHDRQRQTYQEQPLRKAPIAPEDAEIRIGSVGEQNHSQCQFRQNPQPLASNVQAEHTQSIRAEDKADCNEHNRAADP